MPPPPPASHRPFPSSSASSSVSSSAPAGMFKNQLQELAQRSCFNLPSYSCIREGPDHAPRFKATVSFNGEVFESPGYHTTLRQAEHAAAEVALSSLSQRGPTQSLAARILDETGVCKNLLQETAQRAGVSLPVYTTIRSGPKHLPLFKCMVEVGGRRFMGEPAKTKKQAEKNAALAAWSSLKQLSTASHPSFLLDSANDDDAAEKAALPNQLSSSSTSTSSRPRPRTIVTVRDKSRAGRDGFLATQVYAPFSSSEALSRDRISSGQYAYHHQQCGVLPTSGEAAGFDAGQRYLYAAHSSLSGGPQLEDAHFRRAAAAAGGGRGFYSAQASSSHKGASFRSGRQSGGRHQRRHSLSGMESPANAQDFVASSMASGGGSLYGGNRLYHQQQHLRIRGLPYQSLSDRFDLNRSSLLEELQQREEEEEKMMRSETALPSSAARPQHLRSRMQSQSERFDYSNYLPQLDEDCGGRGAEEWCARDCVVGSRPTSSSFNANERENLGKKNSYNEGWLRGETLLQRLEEQKRHGYKEGWLRGDMAGHALMSEERAWSQSHSEAVSSTSRMLSEDVRHNPSNGNQGHVHGGGWAQGADMAAAAEERLQHGGLGFRKEAQRMVDEETVYSAVAAAAAAAASPSAQSQSHLSSLWSKSAQWWGSRMAPLSPSSAAAAIANTLGLRPASSIAPAVRVRHMVPVCSAPPRRAASNEVAAAAPQLTSLHHHLLAEGAAPQQMAGSSMESAEALGQLFNKLRM